MMDPFFSCQTNDGITIHDKLMLLARSGLLCGFTLFFTKILATYLRQEGSGAFKHTPHSSTVNTYPLEMKVNSSQVFLTRLI